MASDIELLEEMRRLLSSFTSMTIPSPGSSSDSFEAYIFSLVLLAAQKEGANIKFEDVNESIPSTIIFRTSPGQIYWKKRPYCHAVIEFPGLEPLEAHIGIYVTGNSSVIHECDVAVIYRNEGITCRRRNATPRCTKVVLAVECKFYSSSIPLSQARSFIGLSTDIGATTCFFAINTDSSSVEKLLTHRNATATRWERKVVPSSSNEVNKLVTSFQTQFRNFVTKKS